MATEPRQQLSDTNTRSRHRALLLSGLPVTERRLQVAGVSTAVLEGGAGPPILLLHGPGDFAGMWMRVIPDLVTTHRVVAPDLPGHGTSELVDGRLDADGLRAWLSGLIERTCPSPPVLVGHVLGGAIGRAFRGESQRPAQSTGARRLVGVGSLPPSTEVCAHDAGVPDAPDRSHVHPLHAAVLVRPRWLASRAGPALGAVPRLQPRTRPWAQREDRRPAVSGIRDPAASRRTISHASQFLPR